MKSVVSCLKILRVKIHDILCVFELNDFATQILY